MLILPVAFGSRTPYRHGCLWQPTYFLHNTYYHLRFWISEVPLLDSTPLAIAQVLSNDSSVWPIPNPSSTHVCVVVILRRTFIHTSSYFINYSLRRLARRLSACSFLMRRAGSMTTYSSLLQLSRLQSLGWHYAPLGTLRALVTGRPRMSSSRLLLPIPSELVHPHFGY